MLSKHQGTGGVTGILQTVHTPAEQRVRGWSPLGVALKVPENLIHFHHFEGERPPTELALSLSASLMAGGSCLEQLATQ
jgi:hypothetical protein